MDALVWEYALASGLESGHLEDILKESWFLEASWILGCHTIQWTDIAASDSWM